MALPDELHPCEHRGWGTTRIHGESQSLAQWDAQSKAEASASTFRTAKWQLNVPFRTKMIIDDILMTYWWHIDTILIQFWYNRKQSLRLAPQLLERSLISGVSSWSTIFSSWLRRGLLLGLLLPRQTSHFSGLCPAWKCENAPPKTIEGPLGIELWCMYKLYKATWIVRFKFFPFKQGEQMGFKDVLS